MDYLDKLNDSEKAYLDKFTAEFHGASFNHDETDIQSYEKYGKDSNDRNNSQNRCLYGNLKNKYSRSNNPKLVNYDNVIGELDNKQDVDNPAQIEDAYIDFIEYTEIEEMLEEYDSAMLLYGPIDA